MNIPWLEHTFYKVQSGWPTSSSPSFGKDHDLEEGTCSPLQEMSSRKIEGQSQEFETNSLHEEA